MTENQSTKSRDSQPTSLRILIVEDDPLMRIGLKQVFEAQSQVEIVCEAADGYAAIEAVSQVATDLVIMDVGLPQLDGIEATRQIKTRFPHVRVLMLTSHEEESEIIAALACGADGYCIKGTSLPQLLGAIAVVSEGAVYLDPLIARSVISHLQPPRLDASQIALSPRELEILRLLVDGRSNPEIADLLYVSLSTVKTHIRNIMNKLAVDDRVQAAVVALRAGLV
jgi:two-component system, NarL family, response regulator LiaR